MQIHKKFYIIKTILIIILIALAFTSSLGYLTNQNRLIYLGKFLGLSPLPRPFRDLGHGEENFNAKTKIFLVRNFETTDISSEIIEKIKKEDRPHRAIVMYYNLAKYTSILNENVREQTLHSVCYLYPHSELIIETSYKNEEKISTRTICN